MATTVHVANISPQTSEKEVREFFSFCGKISDIKTTQTQDGTASASVTFEKGTAAKTALLLDNTQLGPNIVQVTSAATLEELAGGEKAVESSSAEHSDINQEDKPRSRIIAEYLAHGYTISDKAIEKALALDQQHGISARFTSTLQSFDQKYKATERTKDLDNKYGMTEKANSGWQGIASYFEKALDTPTGQRIVSFYQQGEKQVRDVHNEARRLADIKAGKASTQHDASNDKSGADAGGQTALDVDPRIPAPPAGAPATQ